MINSAPANPVLAVVIRSGFTESWHRGAVALLAADGSVSLTAGQAGQPVFPRSSNKPMQAAGMVRLRLDLDGELLALASASHCGEDFHVDGVRKILSGAGLGEDDLRCAASWPIDESVKQAMIRAGEGESRIRMNCSGKHAAMLATCVENGWTTTDYLSAEHPLQVALRDTVAELAGEPVTYTGVDGCGAPLFALSPVGLARGFRAMALAAPGTPERRVADAMLSYPAWVSGTTADGSRLMEAVPGLLLKGGAEGVDAFALPDGRAGAVKLDDGAGRARTPVTVALLRHLGIEVGDELATVAIGGGDAVVGEVRAVL
jgi:L-asparaginase II